MLDTLVERKFHKPVMVKEVLGYLDLKPGKLIVDATIGTGGHSIEILSRIAPGGRLIGIDRDAESLGVAKERLMDYSGSCEFIHGNFVDIEEILKNLNIKEVDGIIFDLGISSYQLDDPDRGFSFQKEGPLDMRLDRTSYISAYDLVNNLNEEEISSLLWTLGEERWHNRIARLLVQERQRHPISTTQELANIVMRSIPHRYRHAHYRIHPATRTFQAVRIAVNRELEILDTAIKKAIGCLKKDGRICVIAFHSLEDRVSKFAFRHAAQEGAVNILTPKPLVPANDEVLDNPRARSSKLRAAERV
ncbi:MAG: 16S rRNA (cytosine(1402)-N(4))-methyltransferase RsmH [Candidatus Omnitrophica bacterium]|nr:16S rRNA (cytosine(1402)-N(4))-methyltransferase RsmH [Candidatus Omnitrophota bacterium]MBU1870284.1 16S rRNA (cytosine(1402)-N(4))-methyltransferase RsmH [Candidatus Omnitrophota bacterium]